jgi:hypothetical protein
MTEGNRNYEGASNRTAVLLQTSVRKDEDMSQPSPENRYGSLGYGLVPLGWADFVGSIILVRQDRHPLLPEEAEAMCDFCQYHLHPLFGTLNEGGNLWLKDAVEEDSGLP